ncbi:MAG: substrate-binding domain-containing protein [Phycisphaerae bacterium]
MSDIILSPRVLILDTDLFHPLAAGITDYARQAGWSSSILFAQRGNASIANMVKSWGADAVIVGGTPHGGDYRRWPRGRTPMVLTHDRGGLQYGAADVVLGFRAAGEMGGQHLVDLGLRNLAYCWLGNWWPLNEQLEGFRAAAEAAGGTVHVLDWSWRAAKGVGRSYSAAIRRWLAEQVRPLPKPLGLMVESDWTALEAEAAFSEAGIRIPEDVAIVSCYNLAPLCEGAIVPLSSVDMDYHEQGYQAAAMLDRLIHGAPLPKEPLYIQPKGVVVRQSSDMVAVPHKGVAAAMNMIRRDFHDPDLSVGRLAGVIGVSTFALNWAFRRHLGRTPGDYLRQWRLKQASVLLATTNRAIKDVAAACGFGTVDQFIRCVRVATGLTPRAWRKTHSKHSGEL